MIYYDGYIDSMDADKQSNYHEWKKTYNVIMDIEIKVETTGISVSDLYDLNDCLERKDIFFMSGNEGVLIVSPLHLTIKDGDEYITYVTFKQLVNSIKLMLFNYNKIYTIEKVEAMIQNKSPKQLL